MKNTGITYTSAERSPVILPEMAELLPPLSAEQLDALEADLIKNGCYSPIIVNEDMVIIDGHNRQALCEKHGLPYTMAVFSFEDMMTCALSRWRETAADGTLWCLRTALMKSRNGRCIRSAAVFRNQSSAVKASVRWQNT